MASGLCLMCSEPARPSRTQCAACAARQAADRLARLAAKLCSCCAEPVHHRSRCRRHYFSQLFSDLRRHLKTHRGRWVKPCASCAMAGHAARQCEFLPTEIAKKLEQVMLRFLSRLTPIGSRSPSLSRRLRRAATGLPYVAPVPCSAAAGRREDELEALSLYMQGWSPEQEFTLRAVMAAHGVGVAPPLEGDRDYGYEFVLTLANGDVIHAPIE